MAAIVRTTGGSKATLWRYFRSKEELFAAVIEHLTQTFREEIEGELHACETFELALTNFCRSFIEKIGTPEAVSTWRLVVGESGRFPELGHIFYEVAPKRIENALVEFLSGQITAGALLDQSPMEMAQLLLRICTGEQNGLLFGVLNDDVGGPKEQAERYVKMFIRLFGNNKID